MSEQLQHFWDSLSSGAAENLMAWAGAFAVLVLGWLVAVVVRAGVSAGLKRVGVNRRLDHVLGQGFDLERMASLAVFWGIVLAVLGMALERLNLSIGQGPIGEMTAQFVGFVPRLVAGAALALVAWVIASLVRALTNKVMSASQIDERLSQAAHMSPMGETLGQVLFWVVVLLFLPAILDALGLTALLTPLTTLLNQALGFVPNAFAAAVIAGVGWVVAKILKHLTAQLLHAAGIDEYAAVGGDMSLSRLGGLLVFVMVLLPALIASLDALHIVSVAQPASDMLRMVLSALPKVLGAALILGLTWVLGRVVAGLVAGVLSGVGVDAWPERIGLSHAFAQAPLSKVVGRLVMFFVMLFASAEAATQLGFSQVSDLLGQFVVFGGDVMLGCVILSVGFWLANVAHGAIDRAAGERSRGLAGVARAAILALVLAMGLRAMGLANEIVNLAFGLTFGAVAVAVALAFGLGAREAAGELAKDWLNKWRGPNA
jgi:flagellar biosynthesis protein FliQ